MMDPALPEYVEFSKMEYVAPSFQEARHRNYELYFFVNTTEDEQPRVIFISTTNQKVELLFAPTATIGIKDFKLYYNPHDLNKVIEICSSESAQDRKHQWQEKFRFTNLVGLMCINCNHMKFLATPEIIKQWTDNGSIS